MSIKALKKVYISETEQDRPPRREKAGLKKNATDFLFLKLHEPMHSFSLQLIYCFLQVKKKKEEAEAEEHRAQVPFYTPQLQPLEMGPPREFCSQPSLTHTDSEDTS